MLKESVRRQLVAIKNENVWLRWLWTEFLRLRGARSLRKYSDLEAIRHMHYTCAGRYPDLENPSLFSEKLQWIKLNYNDPQMSQCADKFEVREYIKSLGYEDLLNDLIRVYESAEAIKLEELPSRFVLKGTHGSGWNMICGNKEVLKWWPWPLLIKSWFKYDYFSNGREFVYRGLKPRIICEKFLEDKSGGLMDYKFFCFMGEPKFVQVNVDRGSKSHVQNFYDLEWSLQPFGKGLPPRPDVKIQAPDNLDRMVEIARDLSSPFPFVRVDLYNVDGTIYFGEFTFFPDSGRPNFVPSEYDSLVGDMLELPAVTA